MKKLEKKVQSWKVKKKKKEMPTNTTQMDRFRGYPIITIALNLLRLWLNCLFLYTSAQIKCKNTLRTENGGAVHKMCLEIRFSLHLNAKRNHAKSSTQLLCSASSLAKLKKKRIRKYVCKKVAKWKQKLEKCQKQTKHTKNKQINIHNRIYKTWFNRFYSPKYIDNSNK